MPLVLRYGYGVNLPLWLEAAAIAAGEIISSYGLGEILISALKPVRQHLFKPQQEA